MDGEAIGLVLARASELRSMISDRIIRRGGGEDDFGGRTSSTEEEEEEAEGLVGIREAFVSLEQQLAALQISMTMGNSKHENKIANEEKSDQSRNKSRGIGHFFEFFAKSVITFVSIVSILTLAGHQPPLKKWPDQFNRIKNMQLFRRRTSEEGRISNREESVNIQCPPGKVLIIKDGKTRLKRELRSHSSRMLQHHI